MAEMKVEKRLMSGGLVAAVLAAIAVVLLLAFGAWLWQLGPGGGTYDPSRDRGIVLEHQGNTWIPADVSRAARFPAGEMVAVGQSEGITLWANREQGIGGGGGVQAPARLETGPYHRVYVKLADGRYLPMVWRSAVPAPTRTGN